MKYKKFKKLAKKHLFILEGYTYDKKGNKEKQIYGLDELYKQLTLTDVGCSFVEYEKQVSLDSVALKDITDDGTVRGRYILDDGKLYKVELVEKFTLLDLK